MAGGEGTRLHPLTQERCKPSVPFNGKHRLVDFVLSNLINSEIYSVYLLVQYKSQALIEHVRHSWTLARFIPDHFVTVVPPQMRNGPEWFQGTADAVYQNIDLIETSNADYVAVFGADHIYRMDVRQMIDAHPRRRRRDGGHHARCRASSAPRSASSKPTRSCASSTSRKSPRPPTACLAAHARTGLDGQLHLLDRRAAARTEARQ
jgi:hypothetical protein